MAKSLFSMYLIVGACIQTKINFMAFLSSMHGFSSHNVVTKLTNQYKKLGILEAEIYISRTEKHPSVCIPFDVSHLTLEPL